MWKRLLIVGGLALVLVVLAARFTPVSGQYARGVTVLCSGCDVELPYVRDGRIFLRPATSGVVLRNDATGELWFYSLNAVSKQMQKMGTLTDVGKPIVWAAPEER